jgi:hypothetical protein
MEYWLLGPYRRRIEDLSVIFLLSGTNTPIRSWHSPVGIATGYGLDCRVRFTERAKMFSAQQRPHWLRDPPSLLYNGYRTPFTQGVKLTTHLHLVSRSRTVEPQLPHPPMSSCRGAYLIKPKDSLTFSDGQCGQGSFVSKCVWAFGRTMYGPIEGFYLHKTTQTQENTDLNSRSEFFSVRS